MHSCPMNRELGRDSYDDNRSHDLPRIYEVLGIDTDEESSASSFIEVDSNSNIIACILISLLVESSCDQSRCNIYLHCGKSKAYSKQGLEGFFLGRAYKALQVLHKALQGSA